MQSILHGATNYVISADQAARLNPVTSVVVSDSK